MIVILIHMYIFISCFEDKKIVYVSLKRLLLLLTRGVPVS